MKPPRYKKFAMTALAALALLQGCGTTFAVSAPPPMVQLSGVDFGYRIAGEEGVVSQVFNNGFQTYVQLRNPQGVYTVLAPSAKGGFRPLSFKREAPYLIFRGVPDQIILVNGGLQVDVTRIAARSPGPLPSMDATQKVVEHSVQGYGAASNMTAYMEIADDAPPITADMGLVGSFVVMRGPAASARQPALQLMPLSAVPKPAPSETSRDAAKEVVLENQELRLRLIGGAMLTNANDRRVIARLARMAKSDKVAALKLTSFSTGERYAKMRMATALKLFADAGVPKEKLLVEGLDKGSGKLSVAVVGS